jgi:hypothetical protein
VIDKILIFAAFLVLIVIAVWLSSGKARKDEKLKQAEDANERNKDTTKIQNAPVAVGIDYIKRMLRKGSK